MIEKSHTADSPPRDSVLDVLSERGSPPPRRPLGSPLTFVGKQAERGNTSLMQRIDALEAERTAGGVILEIDPEEIGHSKFVNRHALSLQLADQDFDALVASMDRDRQDQDIVARPTPNFTPHAAADCKRYEVAFEHRRHAAALV